MSSKVESLQRAALSDPAKIPVSTINQTASNLLQSYLVFPQKFKDIYLVHLLNERAGQRGILFTRTIMETQRLALLLRNIGFPAILIHGQLSQSARLGSLNKIRSRARTLLIAPDVAARGLDILAVDFVVNCDLPQDSKTYIHRVGRTARAAKSGWAFSFVTQYDVEIWLRIETALGIEVDEYKAEKDKFMVLADTVHEAQRKAIVALKEQNEDGMGARSRQRKRGRDEMDKEET
jgi:ATP-dependent RNA helicase DDX47/RRP3